MVRAAVTGQVVNPVAQVPTEDERNLVVSDLFGKAARVGVVLVGRRIVITLFSMVATAVVARAVGVAQFGAYSAALGTAGLLLVVSDFGFSLLLSREMATHIGYRGRLLRSVVRVQTSWNLVLAGVLVLIAFLVGFRTTRGEILLVVSPLLALSGFAAYRQVFLVLFDVRFIARVDVVSNLVMAAATVGLALATKSVVAVTAAFVVTSITAALLIAYVAHGRVDRGTVRSGDLWRTARRAAPLGVISILTSAYFTVDLVLLQFLVRSHPLGEYAAAYKFLSISVTLPNVLLGAALPALAMGRDDPYVRSALTARLTHWLAVVGLPLNVGLCVFAGTAVHLAFGTQYLGAVGLIRILAAAGALICLLNPVGSLMMALGLSRSQILLTVSALAFNVGGNLLLVPIWGVTASAWLTVATEVVAGVGAAIVLRGQVSYRAIGGTVIKPAIGCGALIAVGVAMLRWPAAGIPCAGAAYVIAMSVIRGWPQSVVLVASRAGARLLRRGIA